MSRLHEWSDQRAERLAVADSLDGREQFKERPVSLVRKANELWGDCVPLGQSLKIVQCVELDGLSNLSKQCWDIGSRHEHSVGQRIDMKQGMTISDFGKFTSNSGNHTVSLPTTIQLLRPFESEER